jgi:hypothetical protein
MKKRNLFLMILFSFLTIGVYIAFWLHLTRKDVVRRLGTPKAVPPLVVLFSPFIVLLVGTLAALLLGSHDNSSGPEAGRNLFITLLIPLFIIGILVIPLWWFYKYFKAVHSATGYTDGMLLYIIWMLCIFVAFFPVWMLLVQNDINKAVSRESEHPAPPNPGDIGQYAPPAPPQTPAAPGSY